MTAFERPWGGPSGGPFIREVPAKADPRRIVTRRVDMAGKKSKLEEDGTLSH